MAKSKPIKLEIGPAELAEIIHEWTGRRPSRAEAVDLLALIRVNAQEALEREVFSIITKLADRC